jgi:drug/metabolite transporter (DMT)-like permease
MVSAIETFFICDTIFVMKWIFPLALLIFFEFMADVLAKQWSLHRGFVLAGGALLSYVIANSFWLFALKNGSGLARGAVIFSVASGVIAVVVGLFLYKEEVTRMQAVGLVLGLISIALIFWND